VLTGPGGEKSGLVLEHRQRCIRPIARDFERWLDAVQPTLLPSEPLAAAIRYYKNHWAALFRFVDDPLVPIDNSPAEREFQNLAKLRLNMLFAGSTEGAHPACVLLGIVATCRAQGVPAQATSLGHSIASERTVASSTWRQVQTNAGFAGDGRQSVNQEAVPNVG
jgi:hypothetical protein